MKKFLFTLAALFMAGSAMADNYMYIPDFEVAQSQLGTTITVAVPAHYDNAVSAWEVWINMPEGLTISYAEQGADMTIEYTKANGRTGNLTAPFYFQEAGHYITAVADPGYYQVDGAWVSYGAVKWLPGDYEEMIYMEVDVAADFKGGEIVVITEPACGEDAREDVEPCPKGTHFEKVCTVTVEGGTVEPEVTEKPVITYVDDPEAQTVTVTATGAGHICLYWDDMLQAEGEGTAEWVIPYGDDPEGEEYGISATAQEEGKEVSEYALATIFVPGKEVTPPEPEVTEAPVVTLEVTDDAVIITATGDGEVILYVNDEAVENPYTIARPEAGEDDIIIFVYATAQEEGKEIGTSEVQQVVVEAQEGGEVPPVDPHAEGYWLVTFDMDGNEIWTELTESNGDYNVILRCSYGVYGTFDYYGGETRPNIEYYIVVDGVRYGAADDGTLTVLGEALENPLTENGGNYVLEEGLGKVYNMGVAIDELTGEMYVYAAVAGFTEIDEMNAGKAVAGVRYFNMAGQEMQEANGMTIVVTTYTDGTTSAVKVMK